MNISRRVATLGKRAAQWLWDQACDIEPPDEELLGIASAGLVAPGDAFEVKLPIPWPFVLQGMLVSVPVAEWFAVTSLLVGVEPLLMTNGTPVSLAAFTPMAHPLRFRPTLGHPGSHITLAGVNISSEPALFLASLRGIRYGRSVLVWMSDANPSRER